MRIIRACKEMGVATVAVDSEADRDALHVALADESYCIGGPEPSESHLNENQIISTALLAGAQAIHSGKQVNIMAFVQFLKPKNALEEGGRTVGRSMRMPESRKKPAPTVTSPSR